MFSINLPNLVGWLQETLMKEQKLFWNYSFYLEGQALREKNKEHYEKQKKDENILYLILSALVAKARPNIC